jgi:preprotein translocase subunit SecY
MVDAVSKKNSQGQELCISILVLVVALELLFFLADIIFHQGTPNGYSIFPAASYLEHNDFSDFSAVILSAY